MANKIRPDDCVFIVIDIQERAVPIQDDSAFVIDNLTRLMKGARRFDIPVIIAEQNPSKLGRTPAPILAQIDDYEQYHYVSKRYMSCLKDPDCKKILDSLGKKQLVLAGTETHICVLMTTIDALNQGYEVFVLGDGTTSRRAYNRELGLRRMENDGAVIASTESVLFEMTERSDECEFFDVLKIIK